MGMKLFEISISSSICRPRSLVPALSHIGIITMKQNKTYSLWRNENRSIKVTINFDPLLK